MWNIVWALIWPPGWTLIWACVRLTLHLPPWRKWLRSWLCACFGIVFADTIAAIWAGSTIGVLSAVGALLFWWWRRRKRRRTAALLGAKSRALRDTLVRKAREAAKPKPVLRPVPGGAR